MDVCLTFFNLKGLWVQVNGVQSFTFENPAQLNILPGSKLMFTALDCFLTSKQALDCVLFKAHFYVFTYFSLYFFFFLEARMKVDGRIRNK